MLIRHYQHLEHREGQPFGPDLVLRGTRERLAPMITALLGTAVVLLPLVFAGNTAGLEIVRPMAVVLLGGLLASSLFSLVVIPPLYMRFGRTAEPDPSIDELLIEPLHAEPSGAEWSTAVR